MTWCCKRGWHHFWFLTSVPKYPLRTWPIFVWYFWLGMGSGIRSSSTDLKITDHSLQNTHLPTKNPDFSKKKICQIWHLLSVWGDIFRRWTVGLYTHRTSHNAVRGGETSMPRIGYETPPLTTSPLHTTVYLRHYRCGRSVKLTAHLRAVSASTGHGLFLWRPSAMVGFTNSNSNVNTYFAFAQINSPVMPDHIGKDHTQTVADRLKGRDQ
jgi:hypothetical protein